MLAWSSSPNDPIVPPAASSSSAAAAQYNSSSPYPTPDTYKNTFSDNYYDVPKKKVDAIAEAWGIHEPEPYEDFSAGGGSGRPEGDTPNSSIYNGREGHNNTTTNTTTHHNRQASGGPAIPKRSKDGRDLREVYKEYLEEGSQRQQQQQQQPRRSSNTKRTPLPPPQPIFVPDANHPDLIDAVPLSSPPLTPKRNKSLMQRIRKMRDAPNVPVGTPISTSVGEYDSADVPPSPSSMENHVYPVSAPVRPSHRSQNSFLGRFGGGDRDRGGGGGWGGGKVDNISPTSDSLAVGKDLPATPQGQGYGSATPTPLAGVGEQDTLGYFDEYVGGTNGGDNTSPGAVASGKKTSMLKKVKGVVARGSAAR
jgi:hypothetical protein